MECGQARLFLKLPHFGLVGVRIISNDEEIVVIDEGFRCGGFAPKRVRSFTHLLPLPTQEDLDCLICWGLLQLITGREIWEFRFDEPVFNIPTMN